MENNNSKIVCSETSSSDLNMRECHMRCRIVLLLLHNENVYSKETFIAQEFVRNNRINCSCLLLESVVILESTLCTEFPTDRSSQQRCSMKKRVLRNFAKFTGKHLCQKETQAQVFSCKFCEISKNNFFTEHLWTTVSAACFV